MPANSHPELAQGFYLMESDLFEGLYGGLNHEP